MENQNPQEKSSRRKFLKVAAGVTAMAMTGGAVRFFSEGDKMTDNEALYLGMLHEVEHSRNVRWEYYQKKLTDIVEQTIDNPLPDPFITVGFSISRPDGSSVHLTKRGEELTVEKRWFDPNSQQWTSNETHLDELEAALNDSFNLEVAYRTREYSVSSDESVIKDLSMSAGLDIDPRHIQNLHQIAFKREYNQGLGNKVAQRTILDSYYFRGNENESTLKTYLEDTPNGLSSNKDIDDVTVTFQVGDQQIFAIPDGTLKQSATLLNEHAKGLIMGR